MEIKIRLILRMRDTRAGFIYKTVKFAGTLRDEDARDFEIVGAEMVGNVELEEKG